MTFDFLIVGAGPFGAAFAHEATRRGSRCLVIDRKEHIGGAVYTEPRPGGIQYAKYGPHVFHTESREQWQWLQQFGAFNNYTVRTKAMANGRLYSFPINLLTLQQLYGMKTPTEAEEYFAEARRAVADGFRGDNIADHCIRTIGASLYERFIYGYTAKQWGRKPHTLPASIVQRLPVRTDADDNYFHSRYQGFPEEGWTPIIERMLECSQVELGVDYFADRQRHDQRARRVVYSGLLEQFFDYQFGRLPYRSLRFEDVTAPKVVQGNAVINYCDLDVPWTRITEHKYFTFAQPETSIATKEFALEYDGTNEPFYPIETEENKALHAKYQHLASRISGRYIFGGRCTTYRYYDLRHVFAQARHLAEKAHQ